MAARLEQLAQDWLRQGNPEMANYLKTGVQIARNLRLPESSYINALLTPTYVFEKEKPQEYRPFTDLEKRVLRIDDAFILSLDREKTIEGQKATGRPFRYMSYGGDILLKARSTITEVAIYPDPKRFFIPNSAGEKLILSVQEELTEKDAEELRQRTGLEDLDEIIPSQASILTELTFRYLDETTKKGKGVWLFGRDYGYAYGITKNPTCYFGSYIARVGNADSVRGVAVEDWSYVVGNDNTFVVRLVVAKKR